MTEPTQPHDALFKKTFSQVGHAAGELRAVLPPALVERIDFSSLKLCSGSYVDEARYVAQNPICYSRRKSPKNLRFCISCSSTRVGQTR